MKICVDSVLSEVRKKKSDVSKMLELIKVLSKLRKVRKENVAKKGNSLLTIIIYAYYNYFFILVFSSLFLCFYLITISENYYCVKK